MTEKFLAELEGELIDLARNIGWDGEDGSDRLLALARRIAVEIERAKLESAA